jgi:hypothetical protein
LPRAGLYLRCAPQETGIATLLKRLAEQHIDFKDRAGKVRSNIFVSLVRALS